MKKNLIFIFLIAIVLISAGIWYVKVKEKINSSVLSAPSLIAQVNYSCDNNKTINAAFYKGESKPVKPGEPPTPSGSVKLALSDGRNYDLPQTISADGGRYANGNESFIFWSKGDTAFVNEDATTTFKDCVLNSSGTTSGNQPGVTTNNLLYTNTKYGFTVAYHNSWSVDETGGDGSLVAFGPKSGEGLGFKIYFWQTFPDFGVVSSVDNLKKAVEQRHFGENPTIVVKKIGGFDVVMAENLPGYIDNESEAYVLLDNGMGILNFYPGNWVDSLQKI